MAAFIQKSKKIARTRFTDKELEQVLHFLERHLFQNYTEKELLFKVNTFVAEELDHGKDSPREIDLSSLRRYTKRVQVRFEVSLSKEGVEKERMNQLTMCKLVQKTLLNRVLQDPVETKYGFKHPGGEKGFFEANKRIGKMIGLEAPTKVEIGSGASGSAYKEVFHLFYTILSMQYSPEFAAEIMGVVAKVIESGDTLTISPQGRRILDTQDLQDPKDVIAAETLEESTEEAIKEAGDGV